MVERRPLLDVTGLSKHFDTESSLLKKLLRREPEKLKAVHRASLTLEQNQSIGIVGESGCGKTTLLRTLMGLYEPSDGEIVFRGQPVSDFDATDWKEFRSNVQMIFQDPFNSLDPRMTVKETLREPLRIHDVEERSERVHRMLEQVELNPPENYLDQRPQQLSGGEKQRVAIARALVLEPSVLLADEPVSMLDVSTQASLLNLLSRLKAEMDMSMVYISHDLSTVSYVCDDMCVMYLGRIIEKAPTKTLLDDPKHPYSQALIDAIPIPDPHNDRQRTTIEGAPEEPIGLEEGCRFRDRCPERMDICDRTPDFIEPAEDHQVACHLYYDHSDQEASGVQPTGEPAGTTGGQSS